MKLEIQVNKTMTLDALMKSVKRSLSVFLYHRQHDADEPSKEGHITIKDADDNTEIEVRIAFSDIEVIPPKRYPISFKEFTGCDSVEEFRDKVKRSKDTGYIQSLAVHPEFRRHGYGLTLLQKACESYLKKKVCRRSKSTHASATLHNISMIKRVSEKCGYVLNSMTMKTRMNLYTEKEKPVETT